MIVQHTEAASLLTGSDRRTAGTGGSFLTREGCMAAKCTKHPDQPDLVRDQP